MLTSVPGRLLARRSRSLSPCSRVLQTSSAGAGAHGGPLTEPSRNPLVSTSRVSRKNLLSEPERLGSSVNPSLQYHHLAPRWLSHLENRRGSWAALASRGRNNNRYWDQSGGGGGGERGGSEAGGGAASAGLTAAAAAAAVAFCLKKDSDNKGTYLSGHPVASLHSTSRCKVMTACCRRWCFMF